MGFSLFNPFFAHSVDLLAFWSCHFVIPVVVLIGLCLLGLFLGLLYAFPFTYLQWPSINIGLAFMPLGAFLTHSIGHRLPWVISFSLGILDPFPFLEHPLPILILHSYGLLLSLLGFPGPITTSFTFGVDGLSINP